MHAEFSEWYRAAGMEPTEALPKRWAAIEAYKPDSHGISLGFMSGFPSAVGWQGTGSSLWEKPCDSS
jgi:hypothetical protein